MAVQEKLYTADDLGQLRDNGKIYELHNGVLVEIPAVGERQSALAAWISTLIGNFNMQHNLGGIVMGADGTFILSPFNTRITDAAYITAGNIQNSWTFHHGAPDLAVEIVSPSSTLLEMQKRAGEYLTAGSRLVWIVNPDEKTVDVYRPDGSRVVLRQGALLNGYDVLPGLALSVTTVFSPYGRIL